MVQTRMKERMERGKQNFVDGREINNDQCKDRKVSSYVDNVHGIDHEEAYDYE